MERSSKTLFRILSTIILSIMILTSGFSQKTKETKELNIKKIELGYPIPGIPFYHFKADIEMPQESIIEVEAAVDGKILRATDLKRDADHENMNRPPISERPPSGYSLSQDGTLYKNFNVTGWVR